MTSPERERWIQTGDPTDEAAWLGARLAAGALPRARLQLAAYVGHPAAQLVAARQGPLFRRRTTKAGASHQLRQWVLGLGDVCAPEERVVVARRTLAVLLHGLGHEHSSSALDELLARETPWSVMRTVGGWAQDALSELGDAKVLRKRIRVVLAGWALAAGQESRPYAPEEWYRIGEVLAHDRHGRGFVRRSGTAAVEVEFPRGAKKLPHRR